MHFLCDAVDPAPYWSITKPNAFELMHEIVEQIPAKLVNVHVTTPVVVPGMRHVCAVKEVPSVTRTTQLGGVPVMEKMNRTVKFVIKAAFPSILGIKVLNVVRAL